MRGKLSDSPKALTGAGSESARQALDRQLKAKPRYLEVPPAPHKPSRNSTASLPGKKSPTGEGQGTDRRRMT